MAKDGIFAAKGKADDPDVGLRAAGYGQTLMELRGYVYCSLFRSSPRVALQPYKRRVVCAMQPYSLNS